MVRTALRKGLLAIRRFSQFSSRGAATFSDPLSIYIARTNSGAIKPDTRQTDVVEKLQTLHCELIRDLSAYLSYKNHLSECSNSSQDSHGLYIHGEVGTGKTMLMDMFYDSLPINLKLRTHFHSFMLDVFSRIHKKTMKLDLFSKEPPLDLVADDIFRKSWVLCFDELQLADYTSTAILLNLFSRLFDKGAVIVATSNRPLSELGSTSVQDEHSSFNASELGKLIEIHCNVVSLDSVCDYRNGLHICEQRYFYPLNTASDLSMLTAFQKSLSGVVLDGVEVEVYGRKVQIPEASSCGICKFDFSDLCCVPLGPADYITICNKYHTVFLQNIPVLHFKNKNEARRLINFVDAAYESKVKLYCSAEDKPEKLLKLVPRISSEQLDDDPLLNEMLDELVFNLNTEKAIDQRRLSFITGRDEIFAFRRAISRLREMQSVQYSQQLHREQHFNPYVSTEEDHHHIETIRKARLQRRIEEERDLEEGKISETAEDNTGNQEDWGEEASLVSWQNDIQRRRKSIEGEGSGARRGRGRRTLAPPKLSQFHFWGFGWWENVIKKKKK